MCIIPSKLLAFQIFVVLNSSNTLTYPKGEKNGHRRWPYMRVLIVNRCEYSNFSPLDPFNIYAIAAVLLVDYVYYSQRKPMGVSLVQFNSVNSRERRWSFFFSKPSFAYYELSSVVKKPRISDCCACVVLCFVSPSLFSSIFKFMRISE